MTSCPRLQPYLPRLLGSLLFATCALAQSAKDASRESWVATWGTALQVYVAPAPANPPTPPTPAPSSAPTVAPSPAPTGPQRRFPVPVNVARVTNQTVRMVVRTSVAGQAVRIRLANAAGAAPVTFNAARIARHATGAAIQPGSDRPLTFGGQTTATLPGGATLVSDPVIFDLAASTDLAVSLYVASDVRAPTNHRFGLRTAYFSAEGDHTAALAIEPVAATTENVLWLAGVDVLASSDAATVVTFGDSITDGDQSTPGTLGMWPALLADRLQADPRTRHIGVVNAGISGNRLFGDNNSGLARVQEHVLAVTGVKWMTLLIGINDITGATRGNPATPSLSAETLIAGYRQIIAQARLRGVRVIGCTLTPFGGSPVYTAAGEALRSAVNTWVRTSGEFDAVIDFDAATRDSNDPARFRLEADSPDLLHPGDSGYKLMAEAIDLSLFLTP
ncbi:MAG TPA: SGNH/GDSL hydrolase family protein [Opitutaceae bacterium]